MKRQRESHPERWAPPEKPEHRGSGHAVTCKERRVIARRVKRCLTVIFEEFDAVGLRMSNGNVILAPGYMLEEPGGTNRIATLRDRSAAVRYQLKHGKIVDVWVHGRLLYK